MGHDLFIWDITHSYGTWLIHTWQMCTSDTSATSWTNRDASRKPHGMYCEWVVSYMNESCIWYEWVVPHMNESCSARNPHGKDCEWVVSHMNESYIWYEWVVSHMNELCPIWMSHINTSHDASHHNKPSWDLLLIPWVTSHRQYTPRVMLHTDQSIHVCISHVKYEQSCRNTYHESCHIRMSHVTYELIRDVTRGIYCDTTK